jgi:hypothetical protein
MKRDEVIHALALCLRRAEDIKYGYEYPSVNWTGQTRKDIYWHIRERAMLIAREHDVRIPEVLLAVHELETSTGVIMKNPPFWNQVVHPLILIQEVMEE